MQPTAEWQTGRAAAVPNITVFTKYTRQRFTPCLTSFRLFLCSLLCIWLPRLDSTRLDVSMQHSGATVQRAEISREAQTSKTSNAAFAQHRINSLESSTDGPPKSKHLVLGDIISRPFPPPGI